MKSDINELIVNALVYVAREDLRRGVGKEELLCSLSALISSDLFLKVRERI